MKLFSVVQSFEFQNFNKYNSITLIYKRWIRKRITAVLCFNFYELGHYGSNFIIEEYPQLCVTHAVSSTLQLGVELSTMVRDFLPCWEGMRLILSWGRWSYPLLQSGFYSVEPADSRRRNTPGIIYSNQSKVIHANMVRLYHKPSQSSAKNHLNYLCVGTARLLAYSPVDLYGR